ncbi:hypothetical protein Scep_015013 [Stephania cephalantha]|uniref:Uncharacterized protein n=1 Tax=Stephania cephalantha TaxID=152367 RepID=A0AAP0J4H5_9MAGN
MIRLGLRLWSYVREEASHGRKAPIDPFTRESCKPSASRECHWEEWEVVASQEVLGRFGQMQIIRVYVNLLQSWPIGLLFSYPRDGGNKKYASVLAHRMT